MSSTEGFGGTKLISTHFASRRPTTFFFFFLKSDSLLSFIAQEAVLWATGGERSLSRSLCKEEVARKPEHQQRERRER